MGITSKWELYNAVISAQINLHIFKTFI